MLKREGVLFHWWPFSSKRKNRLLLCYTYITISPFTGTDKFGRVTILVEERALAGLGVVHTDTGGG